MLELQFIAENFNVPSGQVTSTARRGSKWAQQAKPGDRVVLAIGAEPQGFAVITAIKETTLYQVLVDANYNHLCQTLYKDAGYNDAPSRAALFKALQAAYGDLSLDENFTIVSFIRVNN